MSLPFFSLRALVLSCGLCFGPFYVMGQFDISVVYPSGPWHCWDTPYQDFALIVQDPTYPIVIDWNNGTEVYTANNATEYENSRYFEGTGLENDPIYVNVEVTNGNGQVKSRIGTSSPIRVWDVQDFIHYPYSPGDTVRGYAHLDDTWTMEIGSLWSGPVLWLDRSCSPFQENPPGGCTGTWEGLLEPGAIVVLEGENGCAPPSFSNQPKLTIAPPTVLPSWMVLGVEGSCANGPTGSITVTTVDPVSGLPLGWQSYVGVRRASNGSVVNGASVMIPAGGGTATTGPLDAGSYYIYLECGPYVRTDSVLVEVPSLGGTCGTLAGTVYVDTDQNCALNSGEARVRQAVISVEPGPHYTTTSHNGTYRIRTLPTGAYTAEMSHSQVEAQCAPGPLAFSITGSATPVSVNFPSQTTVPMDVEVFLGSGPARPGFEHRMNIAVRNNTPLNTGQLTVSLTFDAGVLEFIGASPAPNSVTGNTATWTLPALNSWGGLSIPIRFQLPPDVDLLGTVLVSSATVATANTDGDLSNNSVTRQSTITGAYDPNDKLALTSSGSDTWWIPGEDEWVDYTIRFQNTGTDTAFNVLISDTLPSALDPASVLVGASSHRYSWSVSGPGILNFGFPGILLPDSNVNEPASHGYVSFRVKMREGRMTEFGEEVSNSANIYFDHNPPVITEPCILTVPVPEEQVRLDATLYLSGAYDAASGLMRDDLRDQGLLPTTEPYTALGYIFQGGGGELVSSAVLSTTGPAAIVDWVVVELRSVTEPALVSYSRAALLRRDGRVVDLDGISPVVIAAPTSSYFLGLRHRNHLTVVLGLDLIFNPDVMTVDFSDPFTPIHGTDAQRNLNGTMVFWPGDGSGDGEVRYTGADNDRDQLLIGIGGSTPTNVVSNVYSTFDVNLDGNLNYTGPNNDRDIMLQTIGGVVPTVVRIEQVP